MGLYTLLVAFLSLYSGLHVLSASDDWGYWGENGPENWPGICTKGDEQSPIDIVTEDAKKKDLGKLKLKDYNQAFSGSLTNTGHSVQISFDGGPIHFEGADLPSTYIFEQMHFHWPAEHTIDSRQAALELHFVHYDKQYGNVSNAAQHKNGVAVVATLFELSRRDNRFLIPIVKATETVSKWIGQSTTKLRSKISPSWYLPKDRTTYYRYDGSLTTPACQESVMWFVLTDKLTVSERQLQVFRRVESSHGALIHNNRPVQPLAGREVYYNLEGYSGANSISSNMLYTFMSIPIARALHANE